MSPQEADRLMGKRGFTIGACRGDGIRLYSYTDIEKTPRFIVSVMLKEENSNSITATCIQ